MALDDAYSKALLHFDADLTDESGKTWTAFGTAAVSTAQKVFGAGSLLLDGSSGITTPAHADFDFGTGDFTVDFRVFFYGVGGGGVNSPNNQYFFDIGSNGYVFRWYGGNYQVIINNTTTIIEAASTPEINTWYHVELSRSGDTWKIFVDGVLLATATSSTSFGSSASVVTIGDYGGTGNFGIYGNIDEFRFSKGIARHTAAFTPPTAAYGPQLTYVNVDTRRILRSAVSVPVDTVRKLSGPISVGVDTRRSTRTAVAVPVDTRRITRGNISVAVDTLRQTRTLVSVPVDTVRRRTIPFGYQAKPSPRHVVVTVDTCRELI